jgi:hypothetical protein
MTVGQNMAVEQQKTSDGQFYIIQEKSTAVVVTPAATQNDVTPTRRSRNRMQKYVIIGVTCVVVVALFVVCTLVAIKLVAQWKTSDEEKVEHHIKAGETAVNETYVKDDTGSWIRKYHITAAGNIEGYVLDDMTRGVRILKRQTLTGNSLCYVLQYQPVVNSSFVPSDSSDSQDEASSEVNSTSLWYDVSERPINDILTFTSQTAKEFCESAEIFFLYPTDSKPTTPDTEIDRRVKRWLYCDQRWTSIVCRYFTFRDHPRVSYFACRFPCYELPD